MYTQRKHSGTKKLFVGLLVILLVVLGALLYLHNHKKSPNLAANQSSQTPVKGTTSKPTPHQAATNNGVSNQGGVIDHNGKTSSTLPPASLWVSSTSGAITLQQPSPNTVVHPGDSLSGLAKVSSVQFILKDDSVGLIAQGNLAVVNGKFSGTLQFTPHAKTGKLEVYYPNSTNGAEEDIIEINVSFSPQ